MKQENVVPYEEPKVVFYGTVEELTLGTGTGFLDSNDPTCGGLAGQPSGPSGFTCKVFP